MDVYDRLDLIIRKVESMVRFNPLTKTMLQASEPCVLDMMDI